MHMEACVHGAFVHMYMGLLCICMCMCVYVRMGICVCIGYMGACAGFGLLFCTPAKAGTNYIKVTGNAPPSSKVVC